ncbi:hypothetical protein AND_009823 [Anopheles darlingi]|uniref:Gustatory receptor n=1 Tax=Anopheles darlingi TaxID=43151 RepID=W5J6V6_ANODA|nr:hypothetical protein AND_009823 [Anopheles darlingi]
MALYSYGIYSYLVLSVSDHLYISKIITVIDNSYVGCQLVTTNFAIGFSWFVRNRIMEFFTQLNEIDEQLANGLGKPVNHAKQHFRLTLMNCLMLGSYLLFVFATVHALPMKVSTLATPWLDMVAIVLSTYCYVLQIVQCGVVTVLIMTRYCALNESFR